jgi:copper chaperone
MKTTATINGMTCVHCVRAVYTALSGVPGVKQADVSIGRAVIEHDSTATPDAIRQAISIAGYEVSDMSHDTRSLPLVV